VPRLRVLLCTPLIETRDFAARTKNDKNQNKTNVAMKPADWRDRQEGVCYMTGHDFTSNSGCAWMNPNGTITLIVHGNSNYTLRIRE
jgi:hypothetical protein